MSEDRDSKSPARCRPHEADHGDASEHRDGGTGREQHEEPPDARNDEDRRADEDLGDEEGLSDDEAARRLDRYGANELGERGRSTIVEFLRHFWGPIPWMIEAAAVLSAVAGKWPDLAVILVLLLINGVVGFWQEHQAGRAIEALKQQVAVHATVKRGGNWQELPAREVIPGDLVHVGVDQIVPADGLLLSGSLSSDESALTGESLPVDKEPGDAVYSGSSASRGEGHVRVAATGTSTRFGRTAELVQGEAPPSHFRRAVLRIGRYLIALSLVLVAVIVAVSLLRGNPLTTTLELALVVTIASVPVALPTVLSVTMAAGARALARRKAIVSRLPALEELAGMQILLVDKTGTITRDEITVHEAAGSDTGNGDAASSDEVLLAAALASQRERKDPIDLAIFDATEEEQLAGYELLEFTPFDPQLKRTQGHVRGPDGAEFHVAKGAVQSITDLVDASGDVRERVEEQAGGFGEQGMRTLAVARTDGGGDWELLGVLALRNPPREDATETLEQAAELGLRVRMLTGDRVEIGRQVADEVGLGDDVRQADAVREAADERELSERVDTVSGFAQVVPEDKHRIAAALQDRDRIVGMTGDGVNDTPALRRAEVGIAVAGSTEAATAASEVVLTEPGLSVIVEALRRSRETFRRMTNYTVYRISETIRIVVFVTLTVVALRIFPISPIQVILLALLNDLAILSIAYDRTEPAGKPVRWRMRQVLGVGSALGIVGVMSSFVLVVLAQGPLGITGPAITTLVYLKLSVAGHLTYFAARTRGPFWSSRPAMIVLVAVVGTQILATAIALTGFLMPSIGWSQVGLAWGWSVVWLFALDAAKVLLNRRLAGDDSGATAGSSQ
ncbi:H+-transporting ATPase [Halopolyspora algeriensis]|uniref:H+-transporting ATPase n=1 Tax=Halopolyspora algeriensis TaxID=1500506 RepID=A0A368VW74_9ACTN|nr:plasma-membrane proton-efflux P-type ATPase [Halopolyspora algeriensis]RCW46099.1 H+-transporting ATPase [Halopolyspora algeriensis]TQM55504.1 H+-transporting ATPase [Halopolyspora algeriensis]